MKNILDKLADEVDKIDESQIDQSRDEKSDSSSPMADLISDDLTFPQVGDVIKGKIINIASSEIYLDLGNFGTGMVIGKEIKDGMSGGKLKIGDEISATIIDLENEEGYIELSVREASHEKAWDDIESKRDTQEKVETRIIGVNKGGLMVEVNGISGFLPVSQLSSKNYPRVEDGDKNKIFNLLKRFNGQEMTVRIIDADRETGKLIVSEKAAQSEKDKESIAKLSIGDVIEGEVSGVVDFGAFIKFVTPGKNPQTASEEDRLEGLVHISELAWQLIENPRDIIKVGDKIKAKIIGIDNEKISLSIRALQKDPWSEIEKNYKIGDVVTGKVKKINHFGAFVYLNKDIHGLAHISEMSEAYPGKNLDELIKVDEDYNWKILSIEPKEHRMGLVLADKKDKAKKKAEPEKEEKPEKASKVTKKTK